MKISARESQTLGVLAAVIATILAITLRPYHWNSTALFHMDRLTAKEHGVTSNFIILTVPGYDGEQYYEIARQMPNILQPSHWQDLQNTPTIAYSYQRFLLPLFAFLLAFGQDSLLPYSFLIIEILSLIAVCFMMLRRFPKQPLYALALALSPAALIGLHFSLAEPLTLALLTAFLIRFTTRNVLHTQDIILLSLFVLTREVNILFIGVLLVYLMTKKRWQDCFLLIIPFATFAALHMLIFGIFSEIPFFWSTDKRALPFASIADILLGHKGFNVYTLSSIALFFGFVLPAWIWSASNGIKRNMSLFLPLASFAFLCLMLVMPDHIWGSITSIGRVITPVYPLVMLQAAERDSLFARILATSILFLGIGIGLSLALIPHPFILSPIL